MDSEIQQLTPEDPVSKEELEELFQLEDAITSIASKMADQEVQKVHMLGAYKRALEQKSRLMSKILVDRGLPPDAPVDIDGDTGRLKLLLPKE